MYPNFCSVPIMPLRIADLMSRLQQNTTLVSDMVTIDHQ